LTSIDDIAVVEIVDARLDSTRIRVKTQRADYGEITLPFPGAHQVANATLAIGAAERIAGDLGGRVGRLRDAYLPGRFETFEEGGKTFILDVAHNDEALKAAITQLAITSPRADNALVFGLMKRKELFDFPRLIAASVGRVYLISAAGDDAYTPQELSQRCIVRGLKHGSPDVILWDRRSEEDDHWGRLLDHLSRPSTPHRRVLITGSHHVVANFGKKLFTRGVRV
jgi:folylpolyglutamate synthase/dihydropteroate synthase